MRAVLSTLHVKIKFPIEPGVIVIKGDQQAARQCLTAVVNWKQGNQISQGEITGQLDGDMEARRPEQGRVEQEDVSRKNPL